ncbi:MAG: NifB/NifX family molybdenum-iron cluster-binding protein [Humidesulfovibrio sp.]|uniref:NifB/NifX family molybdenum-iron cluster-binding protein n=1 Tax=Humidesulfovibrio sp. TaxID=2910988 RepID=UPI0027F62F33|nr:NifB/NifX family molybdenum-iron cluster-binding protein [Humidesulfovibrio sp.]MDQ7834587.1 NifB/NifX family molybdenum-iron cluster-binding protein [Humidesulfovibrio sp.]
MLKIAIPTRGGAVDEHFGHCESFTIYSLNDDKSVASQESFTPPPACGCKSNLIPTLVEMGVSQLIAGNMGEGAVVRLGQAGIKVVRGAAGPVDAALQAWKDGKLADKQILCMAHGDGHECHHGEGH